MNNNFNPDDWSRIESQWQAHYQRVDEIARQGASAKNTLGVKWHWHYGAAAAVVLLVGGAVWMGLQHQRFNAKDSSILVAQHQAPQVVPHPSATSVPPPDDRPQASPLLRRPPAVAPTPAEDPAPSQEPVLQLNNEADGLCLANNAEMDCDDISQLIAEMLLI